jgi:hypothetical protein
MRKELMQSWKGKALLLLSSITICTVVLEVVVRGYDATRGRGFFSEYRNPISNGLNPIRPFRIFGFEAYGVKDGLKCISSRWGELYPLKKPKDTFRIVVFGGSTSENGNNFGQSGIHYPLVLQLELRRAIRTKTVEVINVANQGYSTAQSLVLLEFDVLSWDPDLIIVSHNINDLLVSYWPNFAFDYSNKFGTVFYSVPDYKSLFTIPNVLFQHSQLYWLVQSRIESFRGPKVTPIRRKSYGNDPSPVAVQVFERNLRSIVALAKANHIGVILGSQPLESSEEYFRRHEDYNAYNSVIVYPLHAEFVEHHHAFNRSIQQVAQDTGVFFVDNDLVFDGRREYFIDFVHYTDDGVRLLAGNYTDFILKHHIIE